MGKNKFTTISIPAPLAEKIKELIEGTGFTSMSDFATFVFREIVSEENTKTSKKERESIRSKLKALGYID
jgi:Arc/MetJ-type ribon-helix-helix transcriptional regulator